MADKLTRFTWERYVIGPDGPLDPITRHVLLTLATHFNRKLECWPTVELLMQETGLGERTVRQYLTTAEQEGWIHREARKDRGQAWRNYRYTATVPLEGAADRAARRQKAAASGAARSASDTDQGAAAGAKGAAPHAEGAASGDKKVRHDVPINIEVLNISNNKKGNITGSGSPSASPAENPLSDFSKSQHSKTSQEAKGDADAKRTEELRLLGLQWGVAREPRWSNNEYALAILNAQTNRTEKKEATP